MKKIILMCGLLIGMMSCLENEESYEPQSMNHPYDSNFYQKEMTVPGDTIKSNNPTGTDGEDDDPPPTGIKDGTKKEKQNDSIIVILP